MILESVQVGPMGVNCYIVASAKDSQAIIIDPGSEEKKIRKALDKYSLKPALVVNTHGHYDHIGCDDSFNTPVYIHKNDSLMLADPKLNLSFFFSSEHKVSSKVISVEEGDEIKIEGISLKVLHIPGHTPGGIALLLLKPQGEKAVFTGDTLFYRGIGRSDLAGGDESQLIRNIKEKLLVLPEDTVVYPGHGAPSSIGEEKKRNPFLNA